MTAFDIYRLVHIDYSYPGFKSEKSHATIPAKLPGGEVISTSSVSLLLEPEEGTSVIGVIARDLSLCYRTTRSFVRQRLHGAST